MNNETLRFLMKGRMSGGYLDKTIIGESSKRLDIPLVSDLQLREAAEILKSLGRALGQISHYNWTERRILLEANMQIARAREDLKESPQSIGQKSKSETIS